MHTGMMRSHNTRIQEHQQRDYTTVQNRTCSTKQTTSTYYNYDTLQLTAFFIERILRVSSTINILIC